MDNKTKIDKFLSVDDWVLRLTVCIYHLNAVCRCHLHTNPAIKCVRCTILADAKKYWPYHYAQACETYAETKSGKEE
jgi:hypothetical protein